MAFYNEHGWQCIALTHTHSQSVFSVRVARLQNDSQVADNASTFKLYSLPKQKATFLHAMCHPSQFILSAIFRYRNCERLSTSQTHMLQVYDCMMYSVSMLDYYTILIDQLSFARHVCCVCTNCTYCIPITLLSAMWRLLLSSLVFE